MIFAGIAKSSLIDFPGRIACVLFLPGCNYDCYYCHNRALIEGDYEPVAEFNVMDFLRRRSGLLDGVVISGGEPTLQRNLIPFIESIKKLGYEIKLDTNGSSPQIVAELLRRGLCNYYAVDYKAPAARYAEICGADANPYKTLETIELLISAGVDFQVRTTVIPGLKKDDFLTMARELPIVSRYVLNPYRVPGRYKQQDCERILEPPYTAAQIAAFADEIREIQPNVAV